MRHFSLAVLLLISVCVHAGNWVDVVGTEELNSINTESIQMDSDGGYKVTYKVVPRQGVSTISNGKYWDMLIQSNWLDCDQEVYIPLSGTYTMNGKKVWGFDNTQIGPDGEMKGSLRVAQSRTDSGKRLLYFCQVLIPKLMDNNKTVSVDPTPVTPEPVREPRNIDTCQNWKPFKDDEGNPTQFLINYGDESGECF